MTPNINLQPEQPDCLEYTLKDAVVQSWDELMPNSDSGLIHVEYQIGHDGSLDFLTVWASTIRGYWNLVCELWARPLWSHAIGLSFHNGYHSVRFAGELERLMQQHKGCLDVPDRRGLVQVYPPQREVESVTTEVYPNPTLSERLVAALATR